MKTNIKEILRWLAIAAFGGFGIWILVYSNYHVITHSKGDWLTAIFPLAFVVLFALPFFVVAYICFRRRYRQLYSVLGVVVAIVVLGVLMSLPHRWHIIEFFIRHEQNLPWLPILELPVSLICLFVPFYAAVWVSRVCFRLAQGPTIRGSQQVAEKRPPAAPL